MREPKFGIRVPIFMHGSVQKRAHRVHGGLAMKSTSRRPKSSSPRFLLVAGLTIIILLTLLAPAASAHFVNTGFHFTQQSHEQCVKNAADLGHPPAGGAFKSKVESWSWLQTPSGSLDCWNRVEDPLLTRNYGAIWNGSSWELCFATDYVQRYGHSMIALTELGSPYCGASYYMEIAGGWVWHNNAWYGGVIYPYNYINPYYHYLPG